LYLKNERYMSGVVKIRNYSIATMSYSVF